MKSVFVVSHININPCLHFMYILIFYTLVYILVYTFNIQTVQFMH